MVLKNTTFKRIWFAATCLLVLLLVTGSLFAFSASLRNDLTVSTFNSLDEVIQQQKLGFTSKIKGEIDLMKTLAESISQDIEATSYNDLQVSLGRIIENTEFSYMAIVRLNGKGIGDSGIHIDVGDNEYFKKAAQGETFISEPYQPPFDVGEVIAVATPVFSNGRQKAVLVGYYELKEIKGLLFTSFEGNGYAYVCTSDGKVITRTDSPIALDIPNILDAYKDAAVRSGDSHETVLVNMHHGKSGGADYTMEGQRRIMGYTPAGVKDWYIVTVAYYDVIAGEYTKLMSKVSVLCFVIVGIFSLLLGILMRNYYLLKKAQIQKQEAEERVSLAFDATPLGCTLIDRNMKRVIINSEVKRLLDIPEGDEGKYEDIAFNFSPEYQPDGRKSSDLVLRYLNIAFEEGEIDFDWMHQSLSGELIPTHVTLVRLMFKEEYVVAAYIKDMRKEKAAEKKLVYAEKRAQVILDATPFCCQLWDKNYNVIDCNHAAVKLFGLRDKAEYNQRFFELSPPFQPDGTPSHILARNYVREAFETGKKKFEWTHYKLDGEPVPTEITLVRLEYMGQPIVAGFTRDLRGIREAEAKMREADDRAQIMLNATPICCTLWDSDFNVVDCNREALTLFKLADKEEYCKRFAELSPKYQPDGRLSREVGTEYFIKALNEGFCRFEWYYHTIDQKEELPVEATLFRVDYKGEPIIAAYLRDLREQKAMLLEMEKTHQELKLARDAAEQGAKAKLQFLANMSHEIRTPMNAIVGMSELLLEGSLSQKQYSYVNDIKKSSYTLLEIINDILDFSKLESGKMELTCKDYNFKGLIDNIISMSTLIAQRKGLTFRVEKPQDLPEFLYGDEVRLKQVLWNIIGNAVKYTREGCIDFNVQDLDDKLTFHISDTGIGIRQEDLKDLFEPFKQMDRQKNYFVSGTGLGLSIAKYYVDLMEGSIQVQSVYGQGTTFSITIPKVVGEEVEEETHHTQHYILSSSADVLVVDDNEINLNVAKGLFGSLGVEVVTVDSGIEAIHLVGSKHFDVIFMDHMMPDMDGIETTARIRNLGEDFKDIPIIALTANAIKGAKEMFLASGMDDFISKPINKTELNNVLLKWLPRDKVKLRSKDGEIIELNKTDQGDLDIKHLFMHCVPELNLNIGLERVGGDFENYMKSLHIFVRKTPDNCNLLKTYLRSGDMKNYTIEVHGIKGSLANLGCMRLCERAKELETASKEGNILFCSDNTKKFNQELLALCSKLKTILRSSQNDEVLEKEKCSDGLYRENLQKILTAIEHYDVDTAYEFIDELLLYKHEGGIESKLYGIKDYLDEFDYKNSLKLLEELAG